jgi:hypothetical protein
MTSVTISDKFEWDPKSFEVASVEGLEDVGGPFDESRVLIIPGKIPGCYIKYPSGWTLSIQWHQHAYCERRSFGYTSDDWYPRAAVSRDAEIAVWVNSSSLLPLSSSDTVEGWVPTKTVLELIDTMDKFPETESTYAGYKWDEPIDEGIPEDVLVNLNKIREILNHED